MLCVNLQTSFMHPPFGFALFYLRGVAPKEVKSSDIYWGAIPWVFLQLILVALVVAFPKQVTMFLDKPSTYDLDEDRDRRARRSAAIESAGDADGAGRAPAKTGDPLQDMLNQQQEDEAKGRQGARGRVQEVARQRARRHARKSPAIAGLFRRGGVELTTSSRRCAGAWPAVAM